MGGDAQMPDLSRVSGPEQGLQRAAGGDGLGQLLRRGIVELIQVDVVGLQILQAALNVRRHGLLRAGHALGGQDEAVPDACQAVAQVFLADGVAPGGVDVVDPGLRQPLHQIPGTLPVDALDGDAAEAQTGDPQSGFAQCDVFHKGALPDFFSIIRDFSGKGNRAIRRIANP